tara:strand:+ start:329 stop:439 length:111 start_codon:yes stop_codon:yes gene_type:complete
MEQLNLEYIEDLSERDKEFEAKLISIMKTELPAEFE